MNKVIRKLGITISVVIMLVAMVTIVSADSAQVSIGSYELDYGSGTEEVVIPITFTKNDKGITGAVFEITYDEGLTVTKITKGTAWPDITLTKPGNLTTVPLKLLFDGVDADTSEGVIANITFTVPRDVAKVYNLKINVVECKLMDPIDSTISEDINVTAYNGTVSVKSASYTVSYNANGGTNAPSAQTKIGKTELKLSTDVPTRDGYTFGGWTTDLSTATAEYAAGAAFNRDADTTLYAVWALGIPTYVIGDTDGDGLLTVLDAIVLARHIARWGGYETLPFVR